MCAFGRKKIGINSLTKTTQTIRRFEINSLPHNTDRESIE